MNHHTFKSQIGSPRRFGSRERDGKTCFDEMGGGGEGGQKAWGTHHGRATCQLDESMAAFVH